jgi:predicted deacylase
MKRIDHSLQPAQIGTSRSVTSFHYGAENDGAGSGEKAYLQASLHADELPGMLVMHHLKGLLDTAESEGRIRGSIVLVPVANPIGLAQGLLHGRIGRFEAASGENFNRGYPDYLSAITPAVEARLGPDADANRATIRAAMRAHIDGIAPATELESLRKTLSSLACDADLVMDLHCDLEAVLHLYCEEPYWPQCEALSRLLGVEATLLAKNSGGASFDEHLSGPWWQLDERLERTRGAERPAIPMGCMAVTVELRGQADVDHALAAQDARALFDFLVHRGLIAGEAVPLPPLRNAPTPLAGSEDLRAPHAGVVAFLRAPGDRIAAGDAIAEVVDPLSGRVTPVRARYGGLLYARALRRYVGPGESLAHVAGTVPFRTGNLLSP